jgi:hypothetical protein
MRIKYSDKQFIDYGGSIVLISLCRRNISGNLNDPDEHWCIEVRIFGDHYTATHIYLVGKDGDTVFNKEWEIEERVEKVAENEINYAFINGFLDLSDYEEVSK